MEPIAEPGLGHKVRRGAVFDDLDERQGFDARLSSAQINGAADLCHVNDYGLAVHLKQKGWPSALGPPTRIPPRHTSQ